MPSFVGKVVQAFGAVTGWLVAKFGEAKPTSFNLTRAVPVLAGKQYAWPDVRTVYQRVRQAAEAKPARRNATPRRSNGPAAVAGESRARKNPRGGCA
ncbi:MAG: hypothetical protein U0736_04985 [Gemmataceae bacterium]